MQKGLWPQSLGSPRISFSTEGGKGGSGDRKRRKGERMYQRVAKRYQEKIPLEPGNHESGVTT